MTPEQVLAWVESTYGVKLSDDQIQQLAGAIGFTGNNWSPQMADQAMAIVRQAAQDNNIQPVSGGSPGTVGGVGACGGGGNIDNSGGGPTGGIPTDGGPVGGGGIDTAGAEEFKKWFRQTFGREATDAELVNYASGARYSGGTITPRTLAELKDLAIVDQKAKGWLPVGPNQFQWSPFEYEQFSFNEAPPVYQAGPGFQYQEFQAPSLDEITRDPAYQRRLEEGRKALETSAAAKGLLRTGATLKGLTEYGQKVASEEYGSAYQRASQDYERNRDLAYQQFQTGESQRQNQFTAERQGYLDRMNQARDRYMTNRENAMTSWQAKRQEEGMRWQRDYDVWRYLSDDPYRKAQIAAMSAGSA